jgi:hypothetical protein
MVIPFINQSDVNRGAAQMTRRGKASEPATNNDHMRRHRLDLSLEYVLRMSRNLGWIP